MRTLNLLVWTTDPWVLFAYGCAIGMALGVLLTFLLFGDRRNE